MKKRLLTAIIIAVVYVGTLLLTILVHPVFFDIFTVLLMILAGLEVSRAIGDKYGKPIDLLIVADILVGYLCLILVNTFVGGGAGVTAYFGVLAVAFLVCVICNIASKVMTLRNVTSTILVLIYPVSLLIYMLGLNYVGEYYQYAAILLLFLVSTMTDTFAYLVGISIRGPKLCPKISPNKTISGAIGGLLGGMAGGAIVLLFSLFDLFKVNPLGASTVTNILHYLLIGLVGSIFTQLGDLIASYLKRLCGIKDFGTILPGHGGIMDRIDGMIVNGVFIYIYMIVLSML